MTKTTNVTLGTLLEEAQKLTHDLNAKLFMEEFLEFEKSDPSSYKNEIISLLSKHISINT